MDSRSVAKAYFDADRHDDFNAVGAVFSGNAAVTDEGARHEGAAAIRGWWTAAKQKYHHVAVPTEMVIAGQEVFVRATVTGRFPGSPATLTYAFTVKDGQIVNLAIG